MHDTNANQAKFTSKFNGNIKYTIRFIFDIQRYEQITNFQSPDSLFVNVYNSLPPFIQNKLAADKVNVIETQKRALPDDPSPEDIDKAAIYTTLSMQKFFMRHFRPKVTRGNIFRQLLAIRMRYNESPRQTLDRAVTAIKYARKTITLLNAAGTGKAMAGILRADITDILTTIFCTKNNNPTENNQGGINKMVQKQFRQQELSYEHVAKFTPYYTLIDSIVTKVSGAYYAGDEQYHFHHYDPIPLPMWETPVTKTIPTTPSHSVTPKRLTSTRKRKRGQGQQHSHIPPYKRQRPNTNPNPSINKTNPKSRPLSNHNKDTICFRCGKRGHLAMECHSKMDINNNRLHQNDRRKLSQMPYRGDYKPPKRSYNPQSSHPNSHQMHTPTNPNKQWNKYPTQSNNKHIQPHNTSNPSSTNSITPQLNTLIANLHEQASANTHIDPQILQSIQTIHSMVNPNNPPNYNTGQCPQR